MNWGTMGSRVSKLYSYEHCFKHPWKFNSKLTMFTRGIRVCFGRLLVILLRKNTVLTLSSQSVSLCPGSVGLNNLLMMGDSQLAIANKLVQ